MVLATLLGPGPDLQGAVSACSAGAVGWLGKVAADQEERGVEATSLNGLPLVSLTTHWPAATASLSPSACAGG